jgi:hypothetical protein
MENKIFQDTPENEREEALLANCMETTEKTIQRYYTPEEMAQKQKDYAANAIIIRKATEKLNKAKDEWKAATKVPSDQNEYLIRNIRAGYEELEAQVYLFPDFDAGMVGVYDNTGNLLESRRMKPEERQHYIKQQN